MKRFKLILALFLTLTAVSCKTIQYVPVESETKVEYRDSIITKLDTLTVTKTQIERVRDFTGLLDTLNLETSNSKAKAWIDTSTNILTGSLEDKDVPVQVIVPLTEEYHQKDSTSKEQIPIEVVIEKQVKIIPKFWKITGFLGILETLGIILLSYLRLKKTGFFNKILKIFK